MPKYEAMMPVTAFVKVELETDEVLHPRRAKDHRTLVALLRDEGVSVVDDLCEECAEDIIISPNDLDYDRVEDKDISIRRVE